MIVEDQLDHGVSRIGGIQHLEELDELSAAVAVSDQGMDLTGKQINPGQQTERAMAFVLIDHARRSRTSIRRCAAKLIISRSRAASGVLSTWARRFIFPSVIRASSNQVGVSNPTLPSEPSMTTAKPPARYSAIYGRACGRLRSSELHYSQGHDRGTDRQPRSSRSCEPPKKREPQGRG